MGAADGQGLKAGIYVECFLLILIFAILSETIQHFLPESLLSSWGDSQVTWRLFHLSHVRIFYKRNLPSKKRLLITVVVITLLSRHLCHWHAQPLRGPGKKRLPLARFFRDTHRDEEVECLKKAGHRSAVCMRHTARILSR